MRKEDGAGGGIRTHELPTYKVGALGRSAHTSVYHYRFVLTSYVTSQISFAIGGEKSNALEIRTTLS